MRSSLRWLQNLMRIAAGTWRHMRASEVGILAGSLAFATVISLVPLLAVSLSVFKAYGGFESLLKRIEPFILHNLVEASGAELSRLIRRAVQRIHSGTLGFWGAVGLLITSTKLFHDMEWAVQRVWRVRPTRSFVARLIVYWIVMFGGPLLIAGLLGLMSSRDLNLVRTLPKGLVALPFFFVGFFSIYKLVPARKVRWSSALISAVIATAGVEIAQAFYAQLMKGIIRYSKVYGSLASVPIFLLWIFVLWWICLGGVALCATLETGADAKARRWDDF